jgi:hypothetical protein
LDRWGQLEGAKHVFPPVGDLEDARHILRRLGNFRPVEMGVESITAGPIMEFLTGTGVSVSPFELDAALLASDAYVAEYRRSNGKSTDAPFDWPKSKRDLEIFDAIQSKAVSLLMGA